MLRPWWPNMLKGSLAIEIENEGRNPRGLRERWTGMTRRRRPCWLVRRRPASLRGLAYMAGLAQQFVDLTLSLMGCRLSSGRPQRGRTSIHAPG